MSRILRHITLVALILMLGASMEAQVTQISTLETTSSGAARITVSSDTDHYYVLYHKEREAADFSFAIDMRLGEAGSTTLHDRLATADLDQYQVLAHPISAPVDTDGDGVDDLAELSELGSASPFNTAQPVLREDGVTQVPDTTTQRELSFLRSIDVNGAQLDELQTVKFYILDGETDYPRLYFLNGKKNLAHVDFATAVDLELSGQLYRGQIGYHPNIPAPDGTLGTYRFRFQPSDIIPFEEIRKVQRLLAAHLGFVDNNLCFYPLPAALPQVEEEQALYDDSRVCLLYESDLYGDINYLPLNLTEGYGLLRILEEGEMPLQTDVIILNTIPNELSRVGGIITTVPQTPLAHVNLRAIQDQVPNAFIRRALETDSITALLGKFVYYKVEDQAFTLVESTREAVDAHFEALRPKEDQIPPRDLDQTSILSLDDIAFGDSDKFGVKCTNLATMRGFGFEEGTIPWGFGIPFYYYDAFMSYNGFYEMISEQLANPAFTEDVLFQDEWLDDFRDIIKDADMPQWMWDDLTALQESFPEGTSIRCRSSSNNEDLPGFSGAGLYDSKTQHPHEGHISKSVKQVFASTWNFRAFREREFFRVDHLNTAMGILCHPNFTAETVNGVGVSTDPLHGTQNNFYLNSQKGEDLVTNPEASSIPEELLLFREDNSVAPIVLRLSNLNDGEQLMTPEQLEQLRAHLLIIHDEFLDLYDPVVSEGFAMEIEYKITADDRLAIKQARPWAGFWSQIAPVEEEEPEAPTATEHLRLRNNPTQGELLLDVVMEQEGSLNYALYDTAGRKLCAETTLTLTEGPAALTINCVPELGPGLYFLRVELEAEIQSLPFVRI